ncbi:hypothetical protein Sru01_52200 [Sphaerisporangium rufum]|uniref:Uncharacterized protein n=1 Tax=Sphaerisporangium rufum TaxID=1381558 RepID=A0A919R6N0_9ACTN|nr:hypothetical protein Sru01_52200 [Sphaerisporangium rufum]
MEGVGREADVPQRFVEPEVHTFPVVFEDDLTAMDGDDGVQIGHPALLDHLREPFGECVAHEPGSNP